VLCALAAVAVVVFGLRDLAAAGRARRIVASDPVPLVAALPPGRSILVTGATGLIGRRLVAALVGAGHEVTALTRDRATAAGLPAPSASSPTWTRSPTTRGSTPSSTWPASRSPTACGRPPSAGGSSARA
jgi:hypothetical protein